MLGPLLANVVLLVLMHEGGVAASCAPLVGYLQRDGRWEAVLAVTASESFVPGEDLTVQVSMAVSEKQQGLEANLEVSESVEEAKSKLRAGGNLTYRVRFPVPDSAPLPRVTAVTANGAPVCQDEEGTDESQEIQVSHTLMLKDTVSVNNNVISTQQATAAAYGSKYKRNYLLHNDICGKTTTDIMEDKCNDNGALSMIENLHIFPWIVTIFNSELNRVDYAGTLVSVQYVLVDAKELIGEFSTSQSGKSVFTVTNLLAVLGAKNVSNYMQEENVQTRKVTAVIYHPEYDSKIWMTANLALLVLESPVTFTANVRPACLFTTGSSIIGTNAYSVGWDDNAKAFYAQNVPVISWKECQEAEAVFRVLSVVSVNNSVCASRRNGIGLCTRNRRAFSLRLYVADEGDEGNIRWAVGAVFGNQLALATFAVCNMTSYIRYTAVSNYSPWLKILISPHSSEGCGESTNTDQLLVHKGNTTERGDWPWLAAVYVKKKLGLDFACGGTLVSTRHVVTAAHCVTTMPNEAKTANPGKIIVYLGIYHLNNFLEPNNQPKKVSEIIVHPGYTTARPDGKLDSDLAVLVLATLADISAIVRPICLWDEPVKLADNVGTVVGWGADELESSVTEEPRLVRMPLVSNDECVNSHRDFHKLVTENTFCAGSRDGSGPCSGDSGSGMYLPVTSQGGRTTWMLRGVVSRSLKNDTSGTCLLSEYVVLSDVAKLAPWLRGVIGTSQ